MNPIEVGDQWVIILHHAIIQRNERVNELVFDANSIIGLCHEWAVPKWIQRANSCQLKLCTLSNIWIKSANRLWWTKRLPFRNLNTLFIVSVIIRVQSASTTHCSAYMHTDTISHKNAQRAISGDLSRNFPTHPHAITFKPLSQNCIHTESPHLLCTVVHSPLLTYISLWAIVNSPL